MQRPVVMFLAPLLATPMTLAQRAPTVPMTAVSGPKLTQETKLRYLLRQLDLKVEQRRYARELIAQFYGEGGEAAFSIEEVQAVFRELQQATDQGDEERVKQLEAELREIGRGFDREADFFANMKSVLTDEQTAALREARARLERNPAGSLRPVDLWRAARRLKLTKEQRARLDEVHQAFREKMRGAKSLNDDVRFQMTNGLIELIKAELTPDQQSNFELSVRRLRPDLAWTELKPRVPQTRPASAGEASREEQEPNVPEE